MDPTVREITASRIFAERALYSIQWMPWLMRWQAELVVLDTTNQPKISQALEDATCLSESIDRFSKVTADMRGILNHAFLLSGGFVVLVLVCTLIYRVAAGRKTNL